MLNHTYLQKLTELQTSYAYNAHFIHTARSSLIITRKCILSIFFKKILKKHDFGD